MTPTFDPIRDLKMSRVIKAEPSAIWRAWTDRASFERWWVPEPAQCRVVEMDLRPGGALITTISENGGDYTPHLDACFVDLVENERVVFTNALVGGWRPAERPFMTAVITLSRHPQGTVYAAHVMHKDEAQRTLHSKMGFDDGWGTVAAQLACLVEVERPGPGDTR
jgi:uncharacterized protein YndB with AHSA1/START domain